MASLDNTSSQVHQAVQTHYGKTLETTSDLKTTACTAGTKPSAALCKILGKIPSAVTSKFYGCGNPIPLGIQGKDILDLGCGSGRDCYIAAALVGPHGSVTGIDMTDEQLAVARSSMDEYAETLGYPPRMRFLPGYIERLSETGVPASSADVCISNCVVNLSPDKRAVLAGVYGALRMGGEFYFADMYADGRVRPEARENPALVNEGLGGSLYVEDFEQMARAVGFARPRVLAIAPIDVLDRELARQVEGVRFFSITYRLFKLPQAEEDGAAADEGVVSVVYDGRVEGEEAEYVLDVDNRFARGEAVAVDGETLAVLRNGMELHYSVVAVSQCLRPGSATRGQLGQRLDDLRKVARAQQALGAHGGAVLDSVTLAFVQTLAARPPPSDSERTKALDCVLLALTPSGGHRLATVHPAVVDHLSRQLTSLFIPDTPHGPHTPTPEPTRLLALRCWRQMARALGTVQTPAGGLSLKLYWAASLPAEYLALAVCALLDNAELAEDMGLRREALEALADAAGGHGVFADAARLAAVFPGIASALARVALAQPPATRPPAWRRPLAGVRALALDALRHVMATVFSGGDAEGAAEGGWAGRVRRAARSIVDGEPGEEEEDEGGEPVGRLDRVLWRLSGLRHSEHAAVVCAVRRLFGCVALECPGLRHTPGAAVAVETLLVACLQDGEASDEAAGWLRRLAQAAGQQPALGARLVEAAGAAQRQFERHVDGASDDRRRDAVALLAGALWATPDASAVFSAWWRTRGLRALLRAMHVELPGTALLLAEAEAGAPEGCVLGGFRTAALRRVLDVLLTRAAGVFGVEGVRMHVMDAMDAGDAAVRAAGLWVLAHQAMAAGGGEAAAMEYAGACVAAPDAVVSCVALRAVAGLAPLCGAAVAYSLEPLLFPLLLASAAPADAPASSVRRMHAGEALQALASACSFGSVAELLRANVDYIVDAGARQIRAPDAGPEAFLVMAAAVRLMGTAFVVYAEDVVDDALDVCERLVGPQVDAAEPVVVAALGFLEQVAGVVADVERGRGRGRVRMEAPRVAGDPVARVVAELRELDEHARMAELFDLPEDDSDDDHGQEPADPSTDVAVADDPAGSPLAVKIALVVQNLLSSPSSAQQLISLKITQHCVRALHGTKDLLPLINHVWPTLVHRLSLDSGHDTFYVALAACDVVDSVCSEGEAWMRRRVRDDLWRRFMGILRAPGESAVDWRPSERLLCRRVLGTIKTVVECVPLEEGHAWEACCVPLRFVGVEETREEALAVLRALVPVYGDGLWLVLAKLGRTSMDPADIPALPLLPSAQAVASLPKDICQTLGL
ncbi:hypothetical protein GGI15_003030 [Coemansia interrupta]|uniref:Arsenite methyltransferase n=1 Tax=Coemansia interrupta TaxID=1126814 RepID=A0A9W8LJY1_9FUNG|nr:hypothetical protein GGI15_003030 [Coemansia interrupta]